MKHDIPEIVLNHPVSYGFTASQRELNFELSLYSIYLRKSGKYIFTASPCKRKIQYISYYAMPIMLFVFITFIPLNPYIKYTIWLVFSIGIVAGMVAMTGVALRSLQKYPLMILTDDKVFFYRKKPLAYLQIKDSPLVITLKNITSIKLVSRRKIVNGGGTMIQNSPWDGLIIYNSNEQGQNEENLIFFSKPTPNLKKVGKLIAQKCQIELEISNGSLFEGSASYRK